MADGIVHFDGDEQARTRPLGTILEALRGLGARIEGDALPFTVTGTGSLRGGTVTIDASGSSQFVSGLLLSAAAFEEGVTVHHDGKPVPSMPHIDMTVEMLREAGVSVTTPATGGDADTWRVAPGAGARRGLGDRTRSLQRHTVPGRCRSDRRNRQRPVVAVVDDATRRRDPRDPRLDGGPTSLSPMVS